MNLNEYSYGIINLENELYHDNNMCNLRAKIKKCIVLFILYVWHSIIYTEKGWTCGTGKKYKQCCGK